MHVQDYKSDSLKIRNEVCIGCVNFKDWQGFSYTGTARQWVSSPLSEGQGDPKQSKIGSS